MPTLRFSTKAGTLSDLQPRLRSARVAPLHCFTVAEWQDDRQACLRQARVELGSENCIVRSSSRAEDDSEQSNAGAFLSLADVDAEDLQDAVDHVIASYGRTDPLDQVLIQPMLKGVKRSGVAFSHDPSTCAPYRIVNWSEGHNTATVTAGQGGRIWQQAALAPTTPPDELKAVLRLLDELKELFGEIPIDCEFAVTEGPSGEVLWLLQARPLVLKYPVESSRDQADRLRRIEDKVRQSLTPHPFLIGKRTVYGVMPDWNPAEIIGIRPKPLALSLYRELVTDAIWAYQRHNYGYRNLRSFPLMVQFFGLPYIDVRLSFNSFIPSDLDDGLAGRLVDYYIDRLLEEPTLHDKVEFEIVYSCYTLDLPDRLHRLTEAGFSAAECKTIARSLRHLTNKIVHPKEGLWRNDAGKLDMLHARREKLLASPCGPLERIYWLLEDAKRYGTLPFAGLARAGFIAIQFLKSLVAVQVLSPQDYDAFLASISTISGQLARNRATLDRASFLSRYGHLRPGTYDILSPRYDETPDVYFDWNRRPPVPEQPQPFSVTLPQMRDIVKLLESNELHPDPVGLFDFLQSGIELRESAKFSFTRNLSDILAAIAEYGSRLGFSKDDLAYSNIAVFKDLYLEAVDPRGALQRSIEQGKACYADTLRVALPPVIAKPEDVWSFEWPQSAPNFVTLKQVTANVARHDQRDRLAGAIVCIPSADPGFDWLFSHPIKGLITTWGGANSHMAIRAGEMGLPAVIGAGEALYGRWSNARCLHVDCAGRRVEILE